MTILFQLGIASLIILVFVGCAPRNIVEHLPTTATNGAAKIQEPTPLSRPHFTPHTVDNELQPAFGGGNQGSTTIWLESVDADSEITRVELSPEVVQKLDRHWNALAKYHRVKNLSSDPDELARAVFEHTMAFTEMKNSLSESEFIYENTSSKLSEKEVDVIIDLQTSLMRRSRARNVE